LTVLAVHFSTVISSLFNCYRFTFKVLLTIHLIHT